MFKSSSKGRHTMVRPPEIHLPSILKLLLNVTSLPILHHLHFLNILSLTPKGSQSPTAQKQYFFSLGAFCCSLSEPIPSTISIAVLPFTAGPNRSSYSFFYFLLNAYKLTVSKTAKSSHLKEVNILQGFQYQFWFTSAKTRSLCFDLRKLTVFYFTSK